MSTMYITEFADSGPIDPTTLNAQNNGDQTVSFTATPGASTVFKNNTKMVRIQCDGIASLAFGTAPTATTTNMRVIAGETVRFAVPPGQAYKVSAITNT